MAEKPFVHLHLHSEYSILDGMCRLDRLLEEVTRQRMGAVAVTDHGNMFGVLDFYNKARDVGIKPILGCEVYITSGSRFDKSAKKVAKSEAGGSFGGAYNHLTLLCENFEGYKNLLKLCTVGFTEGFYYKPRIDKQILRELSNGIIGLSGCLAGEVSQCLLRDDIEKARQNVREYSDIFGEGNFYLEVMSNGLPEQEKSNKGVLEIAKELGVPLVATNDAHYVYRSDSLAHKAMVCIQTASRMDDPDGLHFDTDEFFLKPPELMWEELGEFPEALRNTTEIANRCDVEISGSGGKLIMPRFEAPEGKSNFEYLRELSYQGAWQRYFNHANDLGWEPGGVPTKTLTPTGDPPPSPGDWEAVAEALPKVVVDRLEYELEILRSKGFLEYFLIVWDFMHFARTQEIAVGPGRGSAAGSIVAYSLRITDIDPLEFGLIFERFLNPERESPPDIDTDFSDKRREEVIRYCAQRYGADCVSQIATFSRMGAKQVVRDVARVLGMPASEGNRIAKAVPDELNIKLQKALEQSPELEAIRHEDPEHERLFEIALIIEGAIRQTSVHAAGIVIGPESLVNLCPLMKTNSGETCSQFEQKHLEHLGLVKMDFLGLKTLSVIEDTIAAIRASGTDFRIEDIPLDDPKAYELLQKGRTNGIFQLESAGMKDLIKKLHPETFQDVIPLVALYRPGPLQSGMVDKFIARKHGAEEVSYDHPDLEPILSETYGTILYQEQVMKIANKIAGYSLGEADMLRRAMGKKKAEEMAAQKERFQQGAADNGYDRKIADRLFDTIEFFAGYGFNKSHSAAYGAIAYQTAYLKANFPSEFMAAIMTNDRNNTAKVVRYVGDCREMGIAVLPPDVNQSKEDFTVTSSGIRFGLAAIKGVGDAAVSAVIREREAGGPFKSLSDLCERVDSGVVNSKIIECLIRSGALVGFGKKQSQLLAAYPEAIDAAASLQKDRAVGQASLFGDFGVGATTELEYPDIAELSDHQRLADEKAYLGFYVSGHPLAEFSREIGKLSTWAAADVAELGPDKKVDIRLVGIITGVRKRKTQRGEMMADVTIEDLTGEVVAIVFARDLDTYLDQLFEGNVVAVEGSAGLGRDKPEILLSSLKPLKRAWQENVKTVHVSVMSEGLEDELLQNLKKTFRRHPGKAGLVFHLKTPRHGEIVIRTGEEFLVAPTPEMEVQVEDLLDDGVVDYEVREYQPTGYGNGKNGYRGRRNGGGGY